MSTHLTPKGIIFMHFVNRMADNKCLPFKMTITEIFHLLLVIFNPLKAVDKKFA